MPNPSTIVFFLWSQGPGQGARDTEQVPQAGLDLGEEPPIPAHSEGLGECQILNSGGMQRGKPARAPQGRRDGVARSRTRVPDSGSECGAGEGQTACVSGGLGLEGPWNVRG